MDAAENKGIEKKIKIQEINKKFEEKKYLEIELRNMKVNILKNTLNCINNSNNNDSTNSCIREEKISLENLNKWKKDQKELYKIK